MKTKIMALMIILMFMCSGCGNWMCENLGLFCPYSSTTPPEFNTGKDISQAQEIVEKSTKEIKDATGDIAKETISIKKQIDQTKEKISTEIRKEIDVHLNNINESSNTISEKTQDINKSIAELSGANSLLNNAGKKIGTIEKALDKITKERDQAIKDRDEALADRDSQLHKALQWLIVSCIVGCGAFIVLFFFTGSKGGLMAAGGCGLVMIIAIAVNKFILYLAIGGGILLLLMAGILLYNIYVKNKAFSEVVETVEIAQENMSEEARNKIFGGEGEQGVMKKVQSKETIDLVHKEKNKMGSLWNYVKNKTNKEG